MLYFLDIPHQLSMCPLFKKVVPFLEYLMVQSLKVRLCIVCECNSLTGFIHAMRQHYFLFIYAYMK